MTSIIADASAIVAVLLEEAQTERARSSLRAADRVLCPDFALIECYNAFWKLHRRGAISKVLLLNAPQRIRKVPTELFSTDPLFEPAARLALLLDHPIYDCLYVALTEAAGGRLVTCDKRLATAAERYDKIEVELID